LPLACLIYSGTLFSFTFMGRVSFVLQGTNFSMFIMLQ
jgi:hypothetical protein